VNTDSTNQKILTAVAMNGAVLRL